MRNPHGVFTSKTAFHCQHTWSMLHSVSAQVQPLDPEPLSPPSCQCSHTAACMQFCYCETAYGFMLCLWILQADDGYLYPLERAFFYVQKPPTLLVHDEIESVEFLRQGGTGMLASSAKTFDLSIRMQSSDQVSVGSSPCRRNPSKNPPVKKRKCMSYVSYRSVSTLTC